MLTAKGLRASSLPTALPTPWTLQVSLLTTEFNSGKEEKDFRHVTDTEPNGLVKKVSFV